VGNVPVTLPLAVGERHHDTCLLIGGEQEVCVCVCVAFAHCPLRRWHYSDEIV